MQKTNLTPIRSGFPAIIPHVERVADFIQFAQWFATPRQLREQKTQKEFALVIGLSEDTLTDWKRNACFWPMVQQFLSDWVKERVPDVVNSLYLTASNEGKAPEATAFLRLAGMSIGSRQDKKNNK